MSPVKKKSTKKVAAKKASAKKATKKATAKAAAKPRATKKKVPKKAAAKKSAVKKAPARKKTTAKKAATKKKATARPSAKKAAPKKKAAAKTARKPSAGKPVTDPTSLNFSPYKARKGEEYMNESQLEHFREILSNWKRDLMQEVDRTVTHMQDEATHFPDPNDRATQESEFSLELRTRDRERKLIRKIDETLTKLENEEYGYCEKCGVEIGVQRLEARPTAALCIDCKMLDEIREKQWR